MRDGVRYLNLLAWSELLQEGVGVLQGAQGDDAGRRMRRTQGTHAQGLVRAQVDLYAACSKSNLKVPITLIFSILLYPSTTIQHMIDLISHLSLTTRRPHDAFTTQPWSL